MDDQKPGRGLAAVAERVSNTARHESPKSSPPNTALTPDDKFDGAVENIKALGTLVPMRLWSPVAYREFAFHQAESPPGGAGNCLEEHRTAASTQRHSFAWFEEDSLFHFTSRQIGTNRHRERTLRGKLTNRSSDFHSSDVFYRDVRGTRSIFDRLNAEDLKTDVVQQFTKLLFAQHIFRESLWGL